MAKNVTFRVSYDMTSFRAIEEGNGWVRPSVKADHWFIDEDGVEREVTHGEFFSRLQQLHPEWFTNDTANTDI